MKIEVNYNELYNLGDYMEKMFEELKKDFDEINVISETLSLVLQGSAEQTISTRMKNFNSTQFSQIVNYTHLLGNEVINCAKTYNAEDDEFAQKMKQEASRYGLEDGTILSDTRYQNPNTTSGFVSSVSNQTSTINANNDSNITNINKIENNQQNVDNLQNNNVDDVIIEEIKTTSESMQNIANETVTQANDSVSKSKGMFGGLFGAAAAAMGIKLASNKKGKEETNDQK